MSRLTIPLTILLLGFCCFKSSGATNNNSNYETPPPKPGSIQWDINKQIARERQEQYRKRMQIPAAVSPDVPRAGGADFASSRKMMAAQSPPPAAVSGLSTRVLLFAAAFVVAGIFAARKFVPDALDRFNQRFNPWTPAPVAEAVYTGKIRAEEEAFAEFLTTFRVGPSVAAAALRPPEKIDPVREFFNRAPKLLVAQRSLLHEIGREQDVLARQKILTNLHFEMSSLKGKAAFPEALPVWQMASALEGLLKQLTEKTGNVTPSTLRAVASGVDLLDGLCVPGLKPDMLTDRPLKFLVVDDDSISRQAMSLALKKAFGQPDLAMDGVTAIAQACQRTYDVIFLDVELPDMDGFELCTKIRESVSNRATPVVFVTSHNDFDARAKSTLKGGNDLMGKPFLIFEITVKALTLALRGRLPKQSQNISQTELDKGRADALASVAEPHAPVPVIAPLPPSMADLMQMENLAGAFLARASTQLAPLRDLCREILETSDAEKRQGLLVDGFLRINSLTAGSRSAAVHPACQLAAALEGLFKKMIQDPKHSTPSMLATVSSAVDLLKDLCVPELKRDLAANPPVQMLVVDDDLVARRVIVGALQTVFARPESVENGEAALALAGEKTFDVIFLDVVMPGMDGFEVCAKIRETVPNHATPVVFVTGHGDFETRARMIRNGGNDLLAKPFLAAEITLKALTFVLRGRLDRMKEPPKFTNTTLLRSKS